MSDTVFEQYVDEFGNISVRISNDVVVLTKEDADRMMVKYNQLKDDNAKLRELVSVGLRCCDSRCDGCPYNKHGLCNMDWYENDARYLGVKIDK